MYIYTAQNIRGWLQVRPRGAILIIKLRLKIYIWSNTSLAIVPGVIFRVLCRAVRRFIERSKQLWQVFSNTSHKRESERYFIWLTVSNKRHKTNVEATEQGITVETMWDRERKSEEKLTMCWRCSKTKMTFWLPQQMRSWGTGQGVRRNGQIMNHEGSGLKK